MKKYLAKIGRKILKISFRYRLGKRPFTAKALFWLTDFLCQFEQYKNTHTNDEEHHYVPQLILRRFRISETGTDKGQIWKLDMTDGSINKRGISSVASQKNFYLFRDKDGAQSNFVEKKVFSELLEHFGNQVIKRLNTTNDEPDLTYLEESTLALLVAHQLTRVPAFFRAIEKYLVYGYEKGLLEIKDLGTHESMHEKIVLNGLNVTIDDLLKHKSNLQLKGADNHIGSLSRQIAEHIAEKIYRGNLHILDVPSTFNDRFVISDSPVVLLDFDRMETLQYPAWWDIDKANLWILMPISPTRCIFFTKSKRKEIVVEKENTDLVQVVNFSQYLTAVDGIYSNNEDTLINHLKLFTKELINLKH